MYIENTHSENASDRHTQILLLIYFIKRTQIFIHSFHFISDIYVMPISTKQFIYEIKSPIILRGDIFVHFFQIHNKSRQTELISSIQFHTCAITRNDVDFYKNDISFPLGGNYQLAFQLIHSAVNNFSHFFR
jgi:hypothetical protein